MELKDLCGGEHVLSGVDLGHVEIDSWCGKDDVYSLSFILDGKTYRATEDPSDGYRSMMKEFVEIEDVVKNKFEGQRVFCRMEDGGYYNSEVLVMYDMVTTKIVLRVGTDNRDDYYPSFICEFIPENMLINKDK